MNIYRSEGSSGKTFAEPFHQDQSRAQKPGFFSRIYQSIFGSNPNDISIVVSLMNVDPAAASTVTIVKAGEEKESAVKVVSATQAVADFIPTKPSEVEKSKEEKKLSYKKIFQCQTFAMSAKKAVLEEQIDTVAICRNIFEYIQYWTIEEAEEILKKASKHLMQASMLFKTNPALINNAAAWEKLILFVDREWLACKEKENAGKEISWDFIGSICTLLCQYCPVSIQCKLMQSLDSDKLEFMVTSIGKSVDVDQNYSGDCWHHDPRELTDLQHAFLEHFYLMSLIASDTNVNQTIEKKWVEVPTFIRLAHPKNEPGYSPSLSVFKHFILLAQVKDKDKFVIWRIKRVLERSKGTAIHTICELHKDDPNFVKLLG